MKEGPQLKKFNSVQSPKEWKRFAAYMWGIFKPGYCNYMHKYKGTLYYHTRKYPKLFKDVPRLRMGLGSPA